MSERLADRPAFKYDLFLGIVPYMAMQLTCSLDWVDWVDRVGMV
jgi:hypothetical protein